jgi:hypothetical protein
MFSRFRDLYDIHPRGVLTFKNFETAAGADRFKGLSGAEIRSAPQGIEPLRLDRLDRNGPLSAVPCQLDATATNDEHAPKRKLATRNMTVRPPIRP